MNVEKRRDVLDLYAAKRLVSMLSGQELSPEDAAFLSDARTEIESAEQLNAHIEEIKARGEMMYWNDRESILRNIVIHPVHGAKWLALAQDDALWNQAMEIADECRVYNLAGVLGILTALAIAHSGAVRQGPG